MKFGSDMDLPQKILLLAGMMESAYNLDAWCFFGKDQRVCFSDHEAEFWALLNLNGCMDYVRRHVMKKQAPHVLSDQLGLMWLAEAAEKTDVDTEDSLYFIMFGPFFISSLSPKAFEATLRSMELSPLLMRRIMEIFQEIPVVNESAVQRLAKMLHYCVANENLSVADIQYQGGDPHQREQALLEQTDDLLSENARTMELTIHQAIRSGDPNLGGVFTQNRKSDLGVRYNTGIPLRDEKDILIVNIALCSRAAIDGGLSPKIAQQMEEYYIRRAELCSSVSQLANLNREMMQDLAESVQRCRVRGDISAPVQECLVFVQANLTEPFTLKDLARSVGYTEYYLTRKFKKETGENLTDYIRRTRLDRAKVLLRSTNQTIQAISEQLQFGTRNYFTKVFREETGITPAQYRQGKKEEP